ncbi:hypothetical protein OOK27_27825 [Streptomyces canus]|nr:hypothetical protein [Streptomyces canus]MCX5257877.1 hypothetical protein [Streptomyces canus]
MVDTANGLAEVVQEIAEGQPVEPAKAWDALAVRRAVGEQMPE